MNGESWSITRMGELFEKSIDKGEEGLPTLSVTIDRGLVRRDSIDRKMETTLEADQHLLVRKNDIAYNMMRMWQGASGRAEENGIISPAYVVLRPTKLIDSRFAEYFFKLPHTIKKFQDYSHGLTSDRLRLYYDDFAVIPTRIPPLSEQRKIAAILSTWDRAIELTEKLIAAKQKRKQALMQQLLTGKVRFKEFQGDKPRKVALQKFIDLQSGFAFKSGEFTESGTRLLRGVNITTGHLRWGNHERCWDGNIDEVNKYQLEVDDIVLGMDGSLVGRNYAWIKKSDLPLLLVQRVAKLRAREGLDQRFLFFQIGSTRFHSYVDKVKTVTAIPHISLKDIREYDIFLPSVEEQQKIAGVLLTETEGIEKLSKFIDALKIQKKGLMQQLLTGKVRTI